MAHKYLIWAKLNIMYCRTSWTSQFKWLWKKNCALESDTPATWTSPTYHNGERQTDRMRARGGREGDMISWSTYNLIIAAIKLIYRHTHTHTLSQDFLTLARFLLKIVFLWFQIVKKTEDTDICVHTCLPREQKQTQFEGLIDWQRHTRTEYSSQQ